MEREAGMVYGRGKRMFHAATYHNMRVRGRRREWVNMCVNMCIMVS
jgi:hypothetical protein